jgi:predicted protein tyrosine phosphatase
MKIHTLSRANVENITDHYPNFIGDDSILISIGNPGQSTGDVDESLFGDVLYLHFHDADPNADHGTTAGMKLLDNGQVKSVINFIQDHDPNTLFVQCQAGQSRSCGMAYALHQHFNGGDLKDNWQNYNRFVAEKVKEALRGYSKDFEYYNNIFNNE